ncbi:FAD-binding oxidoreductase [Rummeliibacillus sp. G93]|uniref:NAD(P)/FAD-dependent oxidoreductase n=1 Tax=Rummeliibacillus sp. G93 TaxID=2939494 RepID=UPI00201BFCC6|nr:FAD-dependent oxidoreductase [Rummeliibacillus sp. G93]UQW96290.1 FAD-binding oxidoreductase [Rummeliibacillus sp. G93]
MEIHDGKLYWPNTVLSFEPKEVTPSEIYDAIIVGGGMSGCLTAYALAKEGLQVAILEKRAFGEGSTSANTGLLQYENDIMLCELIDKIGEKAAISFYKSCDMAMSDLESLTAQLPDGADFIRRPSICYASTEEDIAKIQREYKTLQKNGFDCDYWNEDEIGSKMPFKKPAALLTYHDAEVNPLKLVFGVLRKIEDLGGHLLPFTSVLNVEENGELLSVKTSDGVFSTKHIVYTTGYEPTPVGKRKGAILNRSYVIVTKPIKDLTSWYKKALIWETKRPYLYLRTTIDGSIIVGGLDEENPNSDISDELLKKQSQKLLEEAQKLFPTLPLEIEYSYVATFGESKDDLPFVGEHPTNKHQYYLLGYGGNGTVYSMIGSKVIRDLILHKSSSKTKTIQVNRKYGIS